MKTTRHFLLLAFLCAVGPVPAQRPAVVNSDDLEGAISNYTKAIEINPRDANAYDARAEARRRKGDLDGAVADSTKAIELDPRLAGAYITRGLARRKKGDLDGAMADYSDCIARDPMNADGYNALAWLLATASRDSIRDGRKALVLAHKACELTAWKDSNALDTLAAAYAETGDFKEAIRWEKRALSILDDQSAENKVRQRIQLYTEGRRYRQP